MVKTLVNSSRTLVILDAGHGIDTVGKRSPVWPDGTQLFEWEFNRHIVTKISGYLNAALISNAVLVSGDKDMGLLERANLANELYERYKKDYFVYLVSIHGNAFSNPNVHGIEAFSTSGLDVSDLLADIHLEELKSLGWYIRPNSPSKLGKDADFYILKGTKCPSILTETGFYTNRDECKKMLDYFWRHKIALSHVNAMIRIEYDKSITYDYKYTA